MTDNAELLPAIANRWSPRAFSAKPIDRPTLRRLFEAARWASSCFNEQPWRFVVATQEDPAQFAKVLGTLVAKNQDWAKTAWLLGVTAGKRTFSHNGSPDRFGLHDTGAALASLAIQATAEGLQVHGMGGFDAVLARAEFGIPEDFEVGCAFAVGYVDGPGAPPADRQRRGLDEMVFGTVWAKPAL